MKNSGKVCTAEKKTTASWLQMALSVQYVQPNFLPQNINTLGREEKKFLAKQKTKKKQKHTDESHITNPQKYSFLCHFRLW